MIPNSASGPSRGIQGAQQGLGMASSAASAVPVFGAMASGAMDFVGQLLNIKGPKQKRREQREAVRARKNKQLGSFKAAVGGAAQQNAQTVAGGGTLPLPSPPVPQPAPMQMPAPPQTQLQMPQAGGQQQGPLGGQRNNYMMRMLMQGDR